MKTAPNLIVAVNHSDAEARRRGVEPVIPEWYATNADPTAVELVSRFSDGTELRQFVPGARLQLEPEAFPYVSGNC